jgi:hypothetical protein
MKGADAHITVLERRDILLPLQQGSDSRWLHPHIYDWPAAGSESPSAALPLLNWTASRASDVVVQTLNSWSESAEESQPGRAQIRVEWTGERRRVHQPASPADGGKSASGSSERFDFVVLAVGFGLEKDAEPSYWRNETLAQPELGQGKATYIVSGAGDGAMIDLFRLRIAQYRQDRILAELFYGRGALIAALRALNATSASANLFDDLQQLWEDPAHAAEAGGVLEALRLRLRNDTEVVLQVKPKRFAELFAGTKRVSFQNRLLAYLLFKCGGPPIDRRQQR